NRLAQRLSRARLGRDRPACDGRGEGLAATGDGGAVARRTRRFATRGPPAPKLPAGPTRGPLTASTAAVVARRPAHGSRPWAAMVVVSRHSAKPAAPFLPPLRAESANRCFRGGPPGHSHESGNLCYPLSKPNGGPRFTRG